MHGVELHANPRQTSVKTKNLDRDQEVTPMLSSEDEKWLMEGQLKCRESKRVDFSTAVKGNSRRNARGLYPLLALSGHFSIEFQCPLLGEKEPSPDAAQCTLAGRVLA